MNPLVLEGLIEAIKDASEEDLCKLFEVGNSFFFLLWVWPFGVKIDEFVGIFPMLIKHTDVQNIF